MLHDHRHGSLRRWWVVPHPTPDKKARPSDTVSEGLGPGGFFTRGWVWECVRMKNKTSTLLMEVGAEYDTKRLHGRKYFGELLESLEEIPSSVADLL